MLSTSRTAKILALAATGSLLFAGCASGSAASNESADGTTTITWWHNSNNGEGKAYYEKVAKDYEADHPGVDIEVRAMAHEDMVNKLDAAFQSGDMPDVYMERGGGELADHVAAGLTKDLTDLATEEIGILGDTAAGWQIDGKTYALPFSLGVVGFWYNKDLFEQAGITGPGDHGQELLRRHREAQGRGHHPDLGRAPATSGRPLTTGTTRRCASCPEQTS